MREEQYVTETLQGVVLQSKNAPVRWITIPFTYFVKGERFMWSEEKLEYPFTYFVNFVLPYYVFLRQNIPKQKSIKETFNSNISENIKTKMQLIPSAQSKECKGFGQI